MSSIACGDGHITILRPIELFRTTLYCFDECFQQIFLLFPVLAFILTFLIYAFALSGQNGFLNIRSYGELAVKTKVRHVLLILVILCETLYLPLKFHMGAVYLIVQNLKILVHFVLLLCLSRPFFLANFSRFFRFTRVIFFSDILLLYSQVITLFFYSKSVYSLDLIVLIAEAFFSTLFFVLYCQKFTEETLYDPLENESNTLECDEDCSIFNNLLFIWVDPLLKKAFRSPLKDSDDLFTLPNSLQPSNSLKLVYEYLKRDDRYFKNSMIKFLLKHFSGELLSLGFLRLFADSMSFMFPIFLNKILAYLDGEKRDSFNGFYFAFALFVGTFLNSVLISYFNFRMNKLSLKGRTILMNIIYEKLFRVRSANMATFIGTGQLLNLTNTDIERIVNFSPSLFQFITLPVQLLVTLYLLYSQVGIVFLSAVAFILAIIPVNKWICNKIGIYSAKMMKAKDDRLTLMTEVLRAVRTIRMCNWIETFCDRIQIIRDEEVKYLKYRKFLDALCVYFWATTPVIVSSLVFGTYAYINGAQSLNSSMIFTSLALLGMLIQPLNALPWVLNGLIEALVSARRVEKFLFLHEMDPAHDFCNILICDPQFERQMVYKFQDCDFGYINEDNPISQSHIRNISLKVKMGAFIGLIGRVASGKSTFLKTFLNEVNLNRGRLFVCQESVQRGIAYVSQDPWLQDTTIRENILFGKEYDEHLYAEVLDLCNLKKDFTTLPQGDLTLVGNHGTTLSGGQRLRISLARAFYQQFNIFIFDEPFAGLDEQVADHIFNICTKHLLFSGKVVLLATNHLQYLRDTDFILCFAHGRIDKTIHFSELFAINESGVYRDSNGVKHPEAKQIALIENDDDHLETAQKEEEQREIGIVQFTIYKYYFAAIGYCFFMFIVLFVLMMQFSKTLSDFWLSLWTGKKANTNAVTFLTVFIGIAVANSIFTLIRAFSFAIGGIRAAISVHTRLLHSIMRAAMPFFDVIDFGIIINRFSSDTFNVDDALPFTLNIFLAQMGSLLGSLAVIIYGMPWMSALVLLLSIPYFLIQRYFRACSRELKRLCAISLSPIYSWIEDTIQGLVTIRAFCHQKRFVSEFNNRITVYNRIQYANGAVQQWLNLRLQLLGVVVTASVAFVAVALHFYGKDYSSSGLIGLALVYCLSLTGLLNGAVQTFTQTELDLISLERIMNTVQQIQNKYFVDDCRFIDNFSYVGENWPTKGSIEFRDVSARYRPNLRNAVEMLNFMIREGEKVAIIGRTGSGKSTLFQILFGLLSCQTGCVMIDGVDISHISPEKLRSALCLLSQHPFLFSGSIRENMDPAGEYTDEEIHHALFKCHINILCDSLGGLYTQFKESGKNLSVGQRQLFCLARALLHRRKIICLDEMTTNIDAETEKELDSVLHEAFADCTILHIAHNLDAVAHYDRFIWMDSGVVSQILNVEQMRLKFPQLF